MKLRSRSFSWLDAPKMTGKDSEKDSFAKAHDLYLEPQTTIYKWLFQLDDSKSLHRKWLFHQTSILNWLFGVPGRYLLSNTLSISLA